MNAEDEQRLQMSRGITTIWVHLRVELLANPHGLPGPVDDDMQTDDSGPYTKAPHAATELNRAEQDVSKAQAITFQRMYNTAALASVLRESEAHLSYLQWVELEPRIVRAIAHADSLQREFEKELSLVRKVVAEADLTGGFEVVPYGRKTSTGHEKNLLLAREAGVMTQQVWMQEKALSGKRGAEVQNALWHLSDLARANQRIPPGPKANKEHAAPASNGHAPKAPHPPGNEQ